MAENQPPLASDDELTAQSRALLTLAMKRAYHLLEFGSPAVQLSVIRTLVPIISRAATGAAVEAEELTSMRVELQALNQRLLSAS